VLHEGCHYFKKKKCQGCHHVSPSGPCSAASKGPAGPCSPGGHPTVPGGTTGSIALNESSPDSGGAGGVSSSVLGSQGVRVFHLQ
jgi:hypothetical protein